MNEIKDLMNEYNKTEKQKTYINNIFVPVLENIIGSSALAAVPFILFFFIQIAVTSIVPPLNTIVVMLWILLSILIFGLITGYRFLNDDLKLKLLYIAYNLGKQFSPNNVSKVETIEFDTPIAQPSFDENEIHTVMRIVKIFYEGGKISQRELEGKGITRSQWESATRILNSIGIIEKNSKKETILTPPTFNLAKDKIISYYNNL